MGTTIIIVLCVAVLGYLWSVKRNADKNKMLTTPFYTWDVVRNTATRLKTFVTQYETLDDTPQTKQKWLDSFAETIFELGLVNLNNRKLATSYLDRSMVQVFKQNRIASELNEKVRNRFFDDFTSADYENFIKKTAKEVTQSLTKNSKQ